MKPTILCIIFALFIHQLPCFAQSKITISGPDSLAFIAVWNHVQLNQIPLTSLTFRQDLPGKIPIELRFPSNSNLNVNQTLNVKNETAITFELNASKGGYKLMPASETGYQYADTTQLNTNNDNMLPVIIDTLALQKDKNKIEEFDTLKIQVSQQTFEARKLDIMEAYLQNHELNIDQLRYLMAQLSLEDRKLDLLRLSLPYMTDKTRIREVVDEFLLDKNKAKALEILSQ